MSIMTNAADTWGDELRVPEWTFADKLRKARLTIHAQQRTFAEKLGCSPAAYAQWEAGNSRPRDIVPLALRIEAVTKIPAWWLLGMPDPTPPTQGAQGVAEVGPAGIEPTTSTVESLRFVDELLPIDEDAAPVVFLDFTRARDDARKEATAERTRPGEIVALFA